MLSTPFSVIVILKVAPATLDLRFCRRASRLLAQSQKRGVSTLLQKLALSKYRYATNHKCMGPIYHAWSSNYNVSISQLSVCSAAHGNSISSTSSIVYSSPFIHFSPFTSSAAEWLAYWTQAQ